MMLAAMPEGGMAVDPATGLPMDGGIPGAMPGDPGLGGAIPGIGATSAPQTPPPNNPLGKLIWKFKQLPEEAEALWRHRGDHRADRALWRRGREAQAEAEAHAGRDAGESS